MRKNNKPDFTMHQVQRIVKQFMSDDFGDATVEFKRQQYDYLATLNFLNKDYVLRQIRQKMGWI